MIIQRKIDINGRAFTHTKSDEDRYIVRDGIQFEDAYDPTEFGRVYTEGDPIIRYPESAEVLETVITTCIDVTTDDAHRLREMIERAAASLDDGDALDAVELFPVWAEGTDYTQGVRVSYGGKLYRCEQAHTSQAGWEPPNVPALWTEVAKPGEIPVWRQPSGAQDAYQKGDKVHFPTRDDAVYISTVDNNIWSPDVYGWEMQT